MYDDGVLTAATRGDTVATPLRVGVNAQWIGYAGVEMSRPHRDGLTYGHSMTLSTLPSYFVQQPIHALEDLYDKRSSNFHRRADPPLALTVPRGLPVASFIITCCTNSFWFLARC